MEILTISFVYLEKGGGFFCFFFCFFKIRAHFVKGMGKEGFIYKSV